VTEFALDHRPTYADACHLCYEARLAMRSRFPASQPTRRSCQGRPMTCDAPPPCTS
jgi:hypothetical protein